MFRIEAPEASDYFLEFCRCNFVVFDLDVNTLDPVGVRVTNIDVTGTLVKQLMECCFQQPRRQAARRVAGLEIEPFPSIDTAHRFR